MSSNTSCGWLLVGSLLGLATTGCAPRLIVQPRLPVAVEPAGVEQPARAASCRLDPQRRAANDRPGDAPAPDPGGEPASVAPGDRHEPVMDVPVPAPPPDRGRASGAPGSAGQRGTTGTDTGDVVLTLAASRAPSSAARVAFEFFVARGLGRVQAAGIVGNLMQESSVNPASVQSGGPGRGIAQWSAGARWNNLLRFASAHRQSPRALATQLQFLWHELTTVPSYGLAALRAARSVTAATQVFAKSFEACGVCNDRQRVAFAQAALRAYGHRAARHRRA